jgi:hypothetical protein
MVEDREGKPDHCRGVIVSGWLRVGDRWFEVKLTPVGGGRVDRGRWCRPPA